MATVHLGRLLGPVGFSRTVAIKRLHSHYAKDPSFVSMFVDEALVTARVKHPNVVPTLDVVSTEGELFLVMDYVPGENLARCLSKYHKPRQELVPLPIALGVLAGVLHGLHAAHLAKSERGEALNLVHRDVSPQNILVGTDGLPRLLDFGVAKAVGRMHSTQSGSIKGKLCYMAPEQIEGLDVDHHADIFAAGAVLWELLTGERLIKATSEMEVFYKVLRKPFPAPSERTPGLPAKLDEIALRALAREPRARFPSALAMADALEAVGPVASAREIGAWVSTVAREALAARQRLLEELETIPSNTFPPAAMLDATGTGPNLALLSIPPLAPPRSASPSSPYALTTVVDQPTLFASGTHDTLGVSSQSRTGSWTGQQPAPPLGVSKRLFLMGLAGAVTIAITSSWILARQAPGGPAATTLPTAPVVTEPAARATASALPPDAPPPSAHAPPLPPSAVTHPPTAVRPPPVRVPRPRPPTAATPAPPAPEPTPSEPTPAPPDDEKYRRD
jgi:eukaryotic-like serine/threonine-protein kinase